MSTNIKAQIPEKELLITDFSKDSNLEWMIVNDGVMGGISESGMRVSESNIALFSGYLSLENNGGFASTRASFDGSGLKNYSGIKIRVKGDDGRSYQLRLRTDGRFDGISYRSVFETGKDGWQVIELPFDAFQPTYRGRILSDVPQLNPENIRQIGFLIADKRQGNFKLQIDWIKGYSRQM
jgi:monofunctional biosynthetic peptidoglycan transglycosylase